MLGLTVDEALLALEFVVLVPPLALGLWWHWRRRRAAEVRLEGAEARARALEQALDAAPDGWFAWFHGTAAIPAEAAAETDPALGGGTCSRRLAVLMALYGGRQSTFADVLQALQTDDAEALSLATRRLRETGEGFELVLLRPDGDEGRSVRATGHRAVADDGTPLADLVWLRDVTAEEAALGSLTEQWRDLAEENALLRALLDTLPMPVWVRDGGLRVAYANRAYLRALEADDVATVRAGDRELATGTAAREMRALASAARAAGEPRTASFHIVLRGSRRLIEVIEAPAGADVTSGTDERITVGIAQDMTRLETLRVTLEREVASHADVLERLGTAIAIFGPDTRLRFHNTAFAKLWQLDDAWLDEEEPAYAAIMEALRARRRLPEVADYPAYKDRELGRFKSLIEPVEDLLHLPDGKTLRRVLAPHPLGGLLATYEDVTDRLALEASLQQLAAVQRETIDHLYEGIAVFGADGRLRLHNPAFRRLWMLDEDHLDDGPHVTDVAARLPDPLRGSGAWEDARAQLAAPPQNRTVRHARVERGDGVILDTIGVPLPDGGILFTFLDMSDTASVERALRERAEALAAADRLKTEFMANVSYELRAPLTTVLGFAEILENEYYGPLNARQKEYARGMAETAHALVALIDDISDLVTLEAGQMQLGREVFDVHAALASVLALTREAVRRKDLTVNFDCPPDIGPMVGDEQRLKQILYHLLTNAVKFTPAGGHIILAAQPERHGGRRTMVFTIADDGPGIPESEQGRIFETFATAGGTAIPTNDGHGNDGHGNGGLGNGGPGPSGPGLGLALVQRLVDLHDGDIELVSVPGEGTTITIRLPAGERGHD